MKRVALFLMIALFAVSFVSAAGVEVEIDKADFYQGELLQAEIIGTFLENLDSSNVAIYEDGKVHSVPLAGSGLFKLENKYLYYAVLPSKVGNYTLKIEDVSYYLGQEIVDNTTEFVLTIEATLDPYISASEGFIVATDDFDVKVKSLNGIQDVSATFQGNGEEVSKEIGYNAEKTCSFSIDGIEEYTESSLDINGLSIPVFVYPKVSPPGGFINNTELEEQIAGYDNDTEDLIGVSTLPLEEATTQQIQTCADIDGRLCKKAEKCIGPTSYARDIVCCLGTCEEQKSGTGWIWGILIIAVLGAGGYFLYKKYAKTDGMGKKESDERINKFKDRMKLPNIRPEQEVGNFPGLKPKPGLKPQPEVRKGLDRV